MTRNLADIQKKSGEELRGTGVLFYITRERNFLVILFYFISTRFASRDVEAEAGS